MDRCPAYTQMVTEEFNVNVCHAPNKSSVLITTPDGQAIDFKVAKTESSADVVMLLRKWLQCHIDADRAARGTT